MLLLSLCLCACDRYEVLTKTDDGELWNRSTGIRYVSCGLSVKAAHIEIEDGVYARAGKADYYTVQFEDPKYFISESDSVMGGVYRNIEISPITIGNFNPVSAEIFFVGLDERHIDSFPAPKKYFPEGYQFSDEYFDGTPYVQAVVNAMVSGDKVLVPTYVDEDETRHIHLYSPDYPGLLYNVIFLKDISGDCYLYDRETQACVIAPQIIIERFLG